LAVPEKPSIAVLPFQNMSGDPEQEFFADGMVEDIITGLSRIRGFFVIARNSSFAFKGRAVDIKQVGRELGVRYVLEGSVRKAGGRVRITAQLIEADTGNHIWAERYDRDLIDIFAVQDEITTAVVAIIEPKLYAAEKQRLERKAPGSLDAWGSVIRALWHLGRLEPSETAAAEAILLQAIELDRNYARAHALLAWSLGYRIFFGQLAREAGMPRARAAALASLSLDNEDHWSHFASGTVHFVGRHPADAAAALRQSIGINPSFALGYSFLGGALVFSGRLEEGLEALDQGIRMSPLDPFNAVALTWRSNAHFFLGDLGASERDARAALSQRPNFPIGLRALAASLAEAGAVEDARTMLVESFRVEGVELAPGFAVVFRERLPHTSAEYADRYIGALIKAGLQ
jgi:TolB-like protein